MKTDARALIRRAIDAIDAIQNPDEFPGIGRVKRELSDMLSGIDTLTVPERRLRRAGLGRLVTDAWPLCEPVTAAVIEAEAAYLGLP